MNQITEDFHTARQDIINDHPNFDIKKDSRITIFTNCIVALDGAYICFIVRNFESYILCYVVVIIISRECSLITYLHT